MRVVLMGSGYGSNAEAILKALNQNNLGNARVGAVISDNENARILQIAESYNVAAHYVYPGNFKTKFSQEAEQNYIQKIQSFSPELLVLAGFMRILKSAFLNAFPRIINIHPSLLPSFPGLDGVKQAWDYGVKFTGCTVHWVNEGVDQGKIIDQAIVGIEKFDTLDSLRQKVHAAEHILLPEVVKKLSMKELINV